MAKILEIEFKGGRKSFYANPQEFPFIVGDLAVVQAKNGEDLGRVVNMGPLVDRRAGDTVPFQIIRKPGQKDLIQWEENHRLEREAFDDCKKRVEIHHLEMKMVDVEYQFDRNKITFYFTSDNRVDFRALVRELAAKHRTRIELRQIGVRDEAKRIGGVGVCGKSLCCTTFLREFEPVVTQLAKEQNLALNPTKLSGSCGRLMCCLRYEGAFYQESLKRFPQTGTLIKTVKGSGRVKKINIFSDSVLLEYENGEEEEQTLEQINQLIQNRKERKKSIKSKFRKGKKDGFKREKDQENTGH
ncbi:MAG TPA: hypothetical protein ENN03_08930 [bacterium]|nr:hypothetical protein [bacterium]